MGKRDLRLGLFGIGLVIAAFLIWAFWPAPAPPVSTSPEAPIPQHEKPHAPSSASAASRPSADDTNELISATSAERGEFYEQATHLPPEQLLGRWRAAYERGAGSVTLSLLDAALTFSFHDPQASREEVIAAAVNLENDPTAAPELREKLLKLLAKSRSVFGAKVLVRLLTGRIDPELREPALAAVAGIGRADGNGDFPTEVSGTLEAAFEKAGDPRLREALGEGIANVGTPAGVQLLLREAFDRGAGMPGMEATKAAVVEIRNPAAVPVLQERMAASDFGTPAFAACGDALSRLGDPRATGALLEWMRKAPSNAAPLCDEWLARIRDPASIEVLASYSENESFVSDALRLSVTRAMQRWNGK